MLHITCHKNHQFPRTSEESRVFRDHEKLHRLKKRCWSSCGYCGSTRSPQTLSSQTSSFKEERLILVEELKKRNKNETLISQKMSLTFSLRRKEIVEVVPMVSEVLERWPALFIPNEIGYEFKSITNVDLLDTLSLHQHHHNF